MIWSYRRSEAGPKNQLLHFQVSQFRVFKSVTPFDRRVTALAWHPSEPTLCAVGSKGGDLLLWNYVKDEFQSLLVIKLQTLNLL